MLAQKGREQFSVAAEKWSKCDGEAKFGPNQEGFEFPQKGLEQWRKKDISKVRP